MTKAIDEVKSHLRKQMFAARNTLDRKLKQQYDLEICAALQHEITRKNAAVVHAYLPMTGEVDISHCIKWLLANGVKVICPKVMPNRRLQYLELTAYGEFEAGPYNTYHPNSKIVYDGPIDFVIVPGLAFDMAKNRLGYGGGYYDNFLAKHDEAFLAAVCYPFQLVETVPVEAHDVKMDAVIYPPANAGIKIG